MHRWVVLALLFAGGALAQDSGVRRTVLDRMDVPPGYEAVLGSAELPQGAVLARQGSAP